MKFVTSVLVSALATSYVAAKAEEDRMTHLPEMGTFDKYGAFSGYLDIA